jgi:methylenetetrahydrofolate dehydrogenase (NADP+)/methenyltetrahydrofolate cyclohydrolase
MIPLNGSLISQNIYDRIKPIVPKDKFLAAVLVGENPASLSFVKKQKQQAAEKVGIDFRVLEFLETINEESLITAVKSLADDEKCGGIIIQLPLPANFNRQKILDEVPVFKDPDVLSSESNRIFQEGKSLVLPPAVGVIKEILDFQKMDLNDKKVAVVGLGFLVGRPAADWLRNKCRELFLINKGDDFSPIKYADVIILGTGMVGLIKESDVMLNALVIDFGYGKNSEGKLKGDFAPSLTQNPANAGFYTPTPGGTGPILVAQLLLNFCELVSKSR